MKTLTVDPQHRIRLGTEAPFTKFWLIPEPDGYKLHRIPQPPKTKKRSLAEINAALDAARFELTATADEIEKETRAID